jgi:hypothetical protein
VTLRQALCDPAFWWFYLVTLSCGPAMFIPFVHVSASARDSGVAEAQAVGLVGAASRQASQARAPARVIHCRAWISAANAASRGDRHKPACS